MEGGKPEYPPEYPEKNPQSKDENQRQTQPTYDTGTGNRTRATLMEGECSHHCSPATLCFVVQKRRTNKICRKKTKNQQQWISIPKSAKQGKSSAKCVGDAKPTGTGNRGRNPRAKRAGQCTRGGKRDCEGGDKGKHAFIIFCNRRSAKLRREP